MRSFLKKITCRLCGSEYAINKAKKGFGIVVDKNNSHYLCEVCDSGLVLYSEISNYQHSCTINLLKSGDPES
jgi:transposase-like protein